MGINKVEKRKIIEPSDLSRDWIRFVSFRKESNEWSELKMKKKTSRLWIPFHMIIFLWEFSMCVFNRSAITLLKDEKDVYVSVSMQTINSKYLTVWMSLMSHLNVNIECDKWRPTTNIYQISIHCVIHWLAYRFPLTYNFISHDFQCDTVFSNGSCLLVDLYSFDLHIWHHWPFSTLIS